MQTGDNRSRIGLAVAAALAGVAGSPAAPALDAAAATTADTSSTGGLQEVVVTARKRQENLQEVPISIEVFTQKDLSNLAINSMDDYLQKVPSISYISTGPGTQLFVMRGVSDGSNPNYSNTSSTGFMVDDMSMSYGGAQPDLHLYDIQSIQVLNGPQGTTFGAGAMSGAILYVTNKPDLHAFSAGVDFDAGQIQGGQQNWNYQGYVNIPLIDGILGLRASAFSDSHGGFINNELTTRTWVNTAVSDNSQWARNDYNRENVEGGRVALKAQFSEGWDALLTYGFQRQHTLGAWDEDPTLAPRTVSRFGPESNLFETNMVDFHVDGDVGIGDLVFASTYWNQERRQQDEYSQYEQNFNYGAGVNPPYPPPPPYYPGYPGTQEGYTCLTDPFYGGTPFSGCKPALQYYTYNIDPQRWSNEVRLTSKAGGRFHWLVGGYWERTTDHNFSNTYYMPGLQYGGQAFQYSLYAYGLTQATLPPGVWYTYTESSWILQTTEFANINFDVTDKLNVEAGVVHFHDDEAYNTPILGFAFAQNSPSYYTSDSHKWNSKLGVNYKVTDHVMLYADWAQGFRPGGSNSGDPPGCYANGVPQQYTPDTLNNYEFGWKTTSLNNRLLWNGAVYDMDWKDLQALIYDALVCPSSSYNINVGDAHIYGAESNIDFRANENWSTQAAVDYTQSSVTSASNSSYDSYVGERLPFAPYFNWSWNARYTHPVARDLSGYLQFDIAHKGDMYNGLNPQDKNTGLGRILQPSYSIMNLRIGLNPDGDRWLAEFYITNLTDKNAIVYSNTGNFDLRLTTNEPRVFGLRLSYHFGKGAVGAD
ncbi:MAG: TonB-dependent receptor [Steroidobacteraceae bacterium]|jgi:iron complex outermembrane recepter protein